MSKKNKNKKNGERKRKDYFLCDGRFGFGQEFKDSMIVLLDSGDECCRNANENTYGKHCVVVDPDNFEIMWEWLHTGKWIPFYE